MESKIKMRTNPIILGDKRFKKNQKTYMGISRNNDAKMCVTIETKGGVTTLNDITKVSSRKFANIIQMTPLNRREKISYNLTSFIGMSLSMKDIKVAIYFAVISGGLNIIYKKRKIKLNKKEGLVLYSIWKRTDGVVGKFVSRAYIKGEALKEMSDSEFIKSIKILEKYKIIEIKKDGYILKEKIKVIENID